MLISEVPPSGDVSSELTSEISALFEGGTLPFFYMQTRKERRAKPDAAAKQLNPQDARAQNQDIANQFSTKELEWFGCNGYNIALAHFSDWNPRHVITLFSACDNVSLQSRRIGF